MSSLLSNVLSGLAGQKDISLPPMPTAGEFSSPSKGFTEDGISLLDSPDGAPTELCSPPQKRGRSGEDDRVESAKRLCNEYDASLPGSEHNDASVSGSEDDASEYDEGDEDASVYGSEHDDASEADASESGSDYDASEADASESGSEYDASKADASETHDFVPTPPVRNPAQALPEALSALWTELFSTDNIAYLHVLFGDGASYLEEYARRFIEEYFYDGRVFNLPSALRDANAFLTTINVMVRRIRGDDPQTKITFHFHPLNNTHCHNLLALRRVVMAILAYLAPLEARQIAEEEAFLLEQEAIHLEEKAKELRQRAVQLRRH